MQIGYFGMITSKGIKSSGAHITEASIPICRYRPHDEMEFYRVAGLHKDTLRYITCKACLKWWNRRTEERENGKQDGNGGEK